MVEEFSGPANRKADENASHLTQGLLPLAALETALINTPNNYPVSSWRLDDMDLWPLLLTAAVNLRIQMDTSQRKAGTVVGSALWRSLVQADRYLVAPIVGLAVPWLSPIPRALAQDEATLDQYSLEGRVLSMGSRLHARELGPNIIVPTLDIPTLLLKRSGLETMQWLDSAAPNDDALTRSLIPPVHGMAPILRRGRILATAIRSERELPHLTGYMEWLEMLQQYFGFSKHFLTLWFARQVDHARGTARVYEALLSRLGSPRMAIMVNSGFANTIGVVAALRRNGVPVIEVQHGAESPSCITSPEQLVHFSKFNTAPDAFVSWRLEQSNDPKVISVGPITHLLPPLTEHPHEDDPSQVGQLRVLFLKQYDQITARSSGYLANHQVAISLQPGDRGNWLKQIVEAMPDTFFWVRQHGADVGKPLALSDKTHANVEVTLAGKVFLPLLLANCGVHLTRFSAVVLEAAAMGIPSVATHAYARELYGENVPSDLLEVEDNLSEIPDLLTRLRETKSLGDRQELEALERLRNFLLNACHKESTVKNN